MRACAFAVALQRRTLGAVGPPRSPAVDVGPGTSPMHVVVFFLGSRMNKLDGIRALRCVGHDQTHKQQESTTKLSK